MIFFSHSLFTIKFKRLERVPLQFPMSAPVESLLRPMQRKSWMLSYPIASPEACALLREKCPELEIDEFYSTSEDGRRYALFHMDRKVRATAIERGLHILSGCGVNDVLVAGFDGSGLDKAWYAILERHLGQRDARVVMWVKPGKTRSIIPGIAGGAADPAPRPKRLRGDGPVASGSSEVDALRQLLAEKDLLLAEKDTQYDLALAEKDAAHDHALVCRNEEVRLMLLDREADEDRLLDAKEAEIQSLKAVNEQGDSVIRSLKADIVALESRLASAIEVDAELRKHGGSVSQRETELVIDLNAERRRVRELLLQIASSDEDYAKTMARLEERIRQLQGRLADSDSAVLVMRNEAVIWDQERERWGMDLKAARCELDSVRLVARELQAKVGTQALGVDRLKCETRFMVAAETEGVHIKTALSLRNELQMEKASGVFLAKEWKRRTEALRDELHAAQREISVLQKRLQA